LRRRGLRGEHRRDARGWAVDVASDAPDADPGDGVCEATTGGCSLRAALTEASAAAVPGEPVPQVTVVPGIDPVVDAALGPMRADRVHVVGAPPTAFCQSSSPAHVEEG
jgi:hypothetical protein